MSTRIQNLRDSLARRILPRSRSSFIQEFFRGMGTVLEIAPSREANGSAAISEIREWLADEDSVNESLRLDWQCIGRDIFKSMKKFELENADDLRGKTIVGR